MNKKTVFLILILLIIGIYNVLIIYVDKQLQSKDYFTGVYDDCHKVWAARGLYNNRSEQNTPEAMKRAFSLGANGAEVDIHFDIERQQFIVSHDHPVKGTNGELVYTEKNGALLSLDEFLNQVGGNQYFWLDFKNLDDLNDQQTSSVIQHLENITQHHSIKDRLYIEGSNPLLLSKYTDAGFKTILGIHPIRESLFLSSFVINIYKLGYYFNNISVIGMVHGKHVDDPIYGPKTQESLKSIPLFLFHVPDDKNLILKLVNNKAIKVVLVGKDLSINRYSINTCNQ